MEDLLGAAGLLVPLLVPDLIHFASFQGSITLHEARCFYEGAGAAVASTMAGLARRFVWRDLLAAQREVTAGRGARAQALSELLVQALKTLSWLLLCPFITNEGSERSTAIREAAVR
jgi:hypothetical protein